jgi:hypothetical protein
LSAGVYTARVPPWGGGNGGEQVLSASGDHIDGVAGVGGEGRGRRRGWEVDGGGGNEEEYRGRSTGLFTWRTRGTGCFNDVNYVRPSLPPPRPVIRMSDRQKPNCVVCIRVTAATAQVGLRAELDQGWAGSGLEWGFGLNSTRPGLVMTEIRG